MPGIPWLSSEVGKIVCTEFPLLCGDVIGSFVSTDEDFDNYNRYDVFV